MLSKLLRCTALGVLLAALIYSAALSQDRASLSGTRLKFAAEQAVKTIKSRAPQLLRELEEGDEPVRDEVPPMRIWKDVDGNEIEARIRQSFAGMIMFQTSDREMVIGLKDKLSDADKAYLGEGKEPQEEEVEVAEASIANLTLLATVMSGHARHKGRFPTSFDRRYGRTLLSWRVYLLPSLGGEDLFDLFRLDEPWDSDHNRQLIPFMPHYFKSTGSKGESGKTRLQCVTGTGTLFETPKAVALNDVPDGLADTFLMVETPEALAVEWTKPADFNYTEADSIEPLLKSEGGGFLAVFADATPLFVSSKNSVEDVAPAFTRADGKQISVE